MKPASVSAARGTFEAGARIGRYTLASLLGEGGMGAVYRAYDETLRRDVALKMVAGSLALADDGEAVSRRILREARMAASFSHANVVAIFDVGEHDGTPFIVMELVEGRSMRSFVGRGAPATTRATWLLDVARGLAAAHRRGLVHRDIKPENVMVSDEGTVKILDFGIAGPTGRTGRPEWNAEVAATGNTFATLEGGVVFGTPAYTAPEIIEEGVFDARTDQFAWGVLAYEVLSGRHPFADLDVGNLPALLDAISRCEVEPLDARVLGVQDALATAILRALSRAPGERFSSMDALVEAVSGAASGRDAISGTREVDTAAATVALEVVRTSQRVMTPATAARPAPDPRQVDTLPASQAGTTMPSARRAAGRVGRRRVLVGAAAVAITGGAAYFLHRRTAAPPFEVRSMRRLSFGASYSEYPSLSRDGSQLVYDAADGKEDHVYVCDVAENTRTALTKGPGWHYAASLSPSGKHVAFLQVDADGEGSFVAPVDGSSAPKLLTRGVLPPTWTDDGAALWAGTKARAARFDASTFVEQRSIDKLDEGFFANVLELPDGRVVASLSLQSGRGVGILVYDQPGAEPRWIWREPVEDAMTPIHGRPWLLAAKVNASGIVELWQVPIDGGKARRVGGGDVTPKTGLTMSADGSRLAWSNAHPTAVLARLEPETPGAERLRKDSAADRRQWRDDRVCAVPGSSKLLLVSDRRGAPELWVVDSAGVEPPRALTEGGSVTWAAVSRDGVWATYVESSGGIWLTKVDGSQAPQALTTGLRDFKPAFSADAERVYFTRGVGAEAMIMSISRAGGSPTSVVAAPASAPELSPDGRSLAYLAIDDAGALRARLLDLASGVSQEVKVFPPSGYYGMRFSEDGARLLAFTSQAVTEIEVRTSAVVHRFDAGIDEITGVTYLNGKPLASLRVWEGDVWIAEGVFS